MQRTNNHVHVKDAISGKRRPLPGCLSKKDSVFFLFLGVRLKHFQFRLVEGSRKFRDRQALHGRVYILRSWYTHPSYVLSWVDLCEVFRCQSGSDCFPERDDLFWMFVEKGFCFFFFGILLKHCQFRLVEVAGSLGIARHSCENSTMMFRIATVWNTTSIMDLQLSACFGFSFSIHNT